MDNETAGLVFNAWMMYRRHQRVLEATGDYRAANKAAWHTFGLLWLAGWWVVAAPMFLFLCIFWVGFWVPAIVCALAFPLWLHALRKDRAWEAGLTDNFDAPPPIPGDTYLTARMGPSGEALRRPRAITSGRY